MERLYALSQEDAYDLIVLDTPPASAALELLEAPDRVLAAFDRKTLRWIANPAVAAGRLGGELLRHLAPFTGGATLQALAQFLLALQDMVGGFRERAQAVQALLTADTTTFLLVSGADPAGVTEALDFYGVLRLHRVAVDGMVVNRVQPDWVAAADGADLSAPALVADFPGVLAGHLAAIVGEQQDLAAAHRDAVALLEDYLEPTTGVGVVPTLRDDPHDLAALAVVGRYLLDGRGPLPKSALPVA